MNNDLIRVDGKFYKKCKVVMLPTEEETTIIQCIKNTPTGRNKGFIQYCEVTNLNTEYWTHCHLYILSNEDIKEGDWILVGKTVIQASEPYKMEEVQKIIATTDKSLKIESELDAYYRNGIGGAKSIPRPSNEFLKKYYELGDIDEVLVEYNKHFDEDWSDISGAFEIEYESLRVAPDNTITIKPFKEKTYTREEVIEILNKYHSKFVAFGFHSTPFQDWIKENL